MLSSADRALTQRDGLLPGLALLLDDDRLGEWLGERLDGSRADRTAGCHSVRVTGRSLRYKPGVMCVLVADATLPTGPEPCLFWAYAGPPAGKAAKLIETAGNAVLAAEPALGVVATTLAGDRALPTLGRLLHDAAWRARVLGRLLPQAPEAERATIRTLRHNPARRWVGVLGPAAGARVVLRVYAPGGAHRAWKSVAAWEQAGERTPQLLGRHVRREIVAVEYLDGTLLSGADPVCDTGAYRRSGTALARLHSCADVRLHRTARAQQAAASRVAAGYLGRVLPDLRAEATALADALDAAFGAMARVHRPIHGDFSADQVVLGDDGGIGVIDLDRARLGDPASDLACAAAALTRREVVGMLPVGGADRRVADLLAGYALATTPPDPTSLAVHTAAHLLRRSLEPFRRRECEDWPTAAEEMLARARAALASPAPAGGPS